MRADARMGGPGSYRGSIADVAMGDGRPSYRGRVEELKLLEDVIDGAVSGRLTGAVVEGDAGIGKTRLLSEAMAIAQARGYQTAFGRAEELEHTRPFGVLVEAFGCSTSAPDPRRAAIGEMLATHVGERGPMTVTSDPGLQFQVVDGFIDLVEELSMQGPLVIGVDDLQWADPASILTLDALSRRLPYVPLAFMGARRLAPRVEQLDRLVASFVSGGARRFSLRRLRDQEVASLVADVVQAEPGPELLAGVSSTGGNPLFVIELVRALLDTGAIEIEAGRAEVAEISLPPTLRLTILQRLSFLPEEVLDLLRSASVLGSTFTLADLATVTSRSAFDLSPLFQEAFRTGVLDDEGDRVRFRHDVIREAMYADLSRGVRIGLHKEAGQRLAAAGAPALQVAEHLVRGAEHGDVDAITWLIRAAREAAPTSPGVAADLLDRAIELTDSADADLDALLVERADKLLWAGRIPEAEDTCRRLLDRPHDPGPESSARALLGRCLMADGQMHEALPQFERVYRSPVATGPERAASWGSASVAHVFLGQLDQAGAAAVEARKAAEQAGDDFTSSMALTALATVEVFRANLDDALGLVDEGIRRADDSDQRLGHRYLHHLARGHVLIELDRFDAARSTLETGMKVSEQLGARWSLSAYQFMLAVERFGAGEWDEALMAVEAGLELGEESGEKYNLGVGHCLESLIALHRNDRQRAEQATSAAETQLARGGPLYRSHWAMWTRSLLLEADGAAAEAFATLADCWDALTASGMAVEYSMLGPDLVRMALVAGDHRIADEVAKSVAAVAADNDVASLNGAALRCQGLRDSDPEALRGAVDAYAQSPRPLELALAREEAGAAVAARTGDVDAAVELLDAALATYDRLDAARDAARTQQTLRGLGVRRGRRGVRQRPQTGWESLTAAERTVTDLVAEGLTNPQIGERLFVSRRTVQTHLAHVFQKLQISSRTELASAVTRQRERG